MRWHMNVVQIEKHLTLRVFLLLLNKTKVIMKRWRVKIITLYPINSANTELALNGIIEGVKWFFVTVDGT